MYPKTRDLEIVYNLLWKSRAHQADDRANIVGMYDIPSTTLNWTSFKSYILKNSGSSASDIKVSYIESDETEVPICNQNDFLIALYSFRRRARIGEIITLKIEKISARKSAFANVQSSDAESQTLEVKDEATQLQELVDDDSPPKWFTKYMKKFEKKLNDDIKQQLAAQSHKVPLPNCSHALVSRPGKVGKPETHKRARKFDLSKSVEKEICKQCKFEKKIESKLEKLEHKTIKLKAKKLATMKTSTLQQAVKQTQLEKEDFSESSSLINDVTLISSSDKTAGLLYTNSVYLQKWEVTNSGQSAWDDRTELRYAWGSEKLRPTFTILKCPELQPGEKGEISVWFQIPANAGSYECFWHFYDCGRRFGHWIGCQFTVVAFPRRLQDKSMPSSPVTEHITAQLEEVAKELSHHDLTGPDDEIVKHMNQMALTDSSNSLSVKLEKLRDLYAANIASGSDTPNSANSDYVVIQSPVATASDPQMTCVQIGEDVIAGNNDILTEDARQSVASMTSQDLPPIETEIRIDENAKSDYAFVYYNGEKLAFPKHVLRPEYYDSAEKCEESSSSQVDEEVEVKGNARRRRESVSSQDSGKRLFVFPRHSPGFEVVYPVNGLIVDAEEYHSLENSEHAQDARDVYDENVTTSPETIQDSIPSEEIIIGNAAAAASSSSNEIIQPFMQRTRQKTQSKRENIFTEAAILASSAMSTARNVVYKVIETGGGKWVNGHWIADAENSRREVGLKQLYEMGFTNRDLNATLLARYNDDVRRVITELLP